MIKRVYAIANLIIGFAVVAWNYLANTGKINGKTVGGVSDNLDNLFTPAGYAFAIWGIIFIGIISNSIYQVKVAFGDDEELKTKVLTGPWLIIANIGNGAWIWFWLNEETGTSVLIMSVILLALLKVALLLRLEKHKASLTTKLLAWWPNTIYLGWISVALIANIAAYLSKIGWADTVDEVMYTIIMILTALSLNLLMLYSRKMYAFCLVGVWSLAAIAFANSGIEQTIATVAAICSSILLILTMTQYFRMKSSSS